MVTWNAISLAIFLLAVIENAVNVSSSSRCAQATLGDSSYSGNPTIPAMSWTQTPSIVDAGNGHYRVLSRVVHLRNLKEQLESQRSLTFDSPRTEIELINEIHILADTVYLENAVALHGIRSFKVHAREIIASSGSQLDVTPPTWNQEFSRRTAGSNGDNGKDGKNGPRVEIFAGSVSGAFEIIASGANGHSGDHGSKGVNAAPSGDTKPGKSGSACSSQRNGCSSVAGEKGVKGAKGGPGGNAGTPGNGGRAGEIDFRYLTIDGRVQLTSCGGTGAQAARNGQGGDGGRGGEGGLGRSCYSEDMLIRTACVDNGAGSRGDRGDTGDRGDPGTTPSTPGRNGHVSSTAVESGLLDGTSMQSYPLDLLKLMKRRAEDLLLANTDDALGRAALTFVLNVASQNSDALRIEKAVRRKLSFLGIDGYDIFGKNELFAPRIKWEELKNNAESLKKAAMDYEKAYNDIRTTIENSNNFERVAQQMSAVSELQVKAEKDRLEEAKVIAQDEKGLYVRSIGYFEQQMNSLINRVVTMLPQLHARAKFNREDLLAVLQGLTGFASAAASKDPLGAVDSVLGLIGGLQSKQCLGSLESYLTKIKKWMTFGMNYRPLVDSSDLDFSRLDVGSVPEVMQANLEMNKEGLTNDLVCLLDVNIPEGDPLVAQFKQLVESFFIAGSQRIDLIAKCMELDNDIGGFNYDIPLLENTQESIKKLGQTQGTPLSDELRLNFLENLLSSYKVIEQSFMKKVYELQKAFKFRTLWEVNNPLATFRRVAAESAGGTGRLNGIVELTKVLQNFETTETKAVRCFTNNIYTTGIKKWSFNSVDHKAMFDALHNDGSTRFSIKIDRGCPTCYNVRLLKMYIELTGEDSQGSTVPAIVDVQVRHLSGSYFRAGDNTIKQYRQPLGSYRNIPFNRFAISDVQKCNEETQKGSSKSLTKQEI
ncbi:hypothetical protein ACROYT_G005396 [Oculina patagonica]